MFKNTFKSRCWLNKFDNSLDAFFPEIWAQESLMILEAQTVMANLVYKDFSPQVQSFGDVVNTRLPGNFVVKRKGATGDVETQDASATNVPISLNQHLYASFLINDGEESKGFKVLRDEYLVPALRAVSNGLDRILISQQYQFLDNVVGKLGTTPTRALLIDAREKLNNNLAPTENRHLVICPDTEGSLLNTDDFLHVDKAGDAGTAMREGSLGQKLGFNIWMSQNAPNIASGNTVTTSAVNLSGGYAAGTTVIECDAFTPDPVAGEWCTIAGDMTPQFITEYDASDNELTISPGLKYAVANNAAITVYRSGACNETTNHVVGWEKEIVVDGFTVSPRQGQLVSTGVTVGTRNIYGKIDATSLTAILPDRPLVAAVNNDAVIGVGPAGCYNFAFHPQAIALVSRPLAMPGAGLTLAAVANYKGLGVRVVITYDGKAQAHRVTVDLLCGVAVLNEDLGAVVLA